MKRILFIFGIFQIFVVMSLTAEGMYISSEEAMKLREAIPASVQDSIITLRPGIADLGAISLSDFFVRPISTQGNLTNREQSWQLHDDILTLSFQGMIDDQILEIDIQFLVDSEKTVLVDRTLIRYRGEDTESATWEEHQLVFIVLESILE